ncbi:MAG: substrate-binding periplasmic protein [Magnetovibrionaceae bacterium]
MFRRTGPFLVLFSVAALLLDLSPRSLVAQEASDASAPQPLEILVHQRSPYYERVGSGFGGLVAEPMQAALEASGIAYRWREVPANRQLNLVRAAPAPLCAAGWFKKPDRELFATFSEPVYVDQPLVAVTRSDNRDVLSHTRAEDLFEDRSVRLGVKLGYSYGPVVDAMLKAAGTLTITTSQDNVGMVRMMLGRRFDYLLASYEEAPLLIESVGAAAEDLVEVRLDGLPEGNARYLMCSKATPAPVIEAFNQALKSVLDR